MTLLVKINPDHKLIKKLAKMSKDKASVGDIENIGICLYFTQLKIYT